MKKQEAKIEYNSGNGDREVFFFQHSFNSAFEHAESFIERNKGKFQMKCFVLNSSAFGHKWRLDRVIKAN